MNDGGLAVLAMHVARAVRSEQWMDDMACRGLSDLFFSEERSDNSVSTRIAAAKTVCGKCPVRRECLTFANAERCSREWGVYGGTTPDERRRLHFDVDALIASHNAWVVRSTLPEHLYAPDITATLNTGGTNERSAA